MWIDLGANEWVSSGEIVCATRYAADQSTAAGDIFQHLPKIDTASAAREKPRAIVWIARGKETRMAVSPLNIATIF